MMMTDGTGTGTSSRNDGDDGAAANNAAVDVDVDVDEEQEEEEELATGFSLSEQAYYSYYNTTDSSDNNNKGANNNNNKNNIISLETIRNSVVQDMMTIPVSCPFIDSSSSSATESSSQNQKKNKNKYKYKKNNNNGQQQQQQKQQQYLPLIYCDFTASHRPLKSIENYLYTNCLPYYGNTHTNATITSSQSTAFTAEARQAIGEYTSAHITGKASKDVVLFAGNGTTSAVQLLIDCLGLRHYYSDSHQSQDQDQQQQSSTNTTRPLILVGPMEHHSNLLPWRELPNIDIMTVPLSMNQKGGGGGEIDMIKLKEILDDETKDNNRPFIIGSFAAVSNVTGIVTDDIAITQLLHKYNALSVWDYATGASYIKPKMNNHLLSIGGAKDAIVFSGHKLLGGCASTPGVLIVKKHLVSQKNPPINHVGGGTVFYVTSNSHRFLSNRIERWEGGTPNSVGIWRLGLAVKLKLDLITTAAAAMADANNNNNGTTTTTDYLWNIELERAQKFQKDLNKIPNLILLDGGDDDDNDGGTTIQEKKKKKKVPIFSFLIKCGKRFLHYNYVCALLNDLFGIQSRGGCHCAGPYVQYLLGLTPTNNTAIENCLIQSKDELVRPGVTRLSLPSLGTSTQQEQYVIKAIGWIAKHGWKFLPVYRIHHRTGEWRHASRMKGSTPLDKTDRQWLTHYRHPLLQQQQQQQQQQTENGDKKGGSNRDDSSIIVATGSNSSDDDMSITQTNNNSIMTLEEVWDHAQQCLDDIIQDSVSISQTLKLTEDPTMVSSDLRWYVYPKEVVSYLLKLKNPSSSSTSSSSNKINYNDDDYVPGTLDRDNLLGPIRPIAWYGIPSDLLSQVKTISTTMQTTTNPTLPKPNEKDIATPPCCPEEDCSTVGPTAHDDDGKQSKPSADVSNNLAIAAVAEPSSDSVTPTKSTTALPPLHDTSNWFPFRDGEHTGEASWEELEIGFEDGELSEECMYYDPVKDTWRLLRDAVVAKEEEKPAPQIDTSAGENKTEDDNNETAAATESVHVPVPSQSPASKTAETKKASKKPSRDSATWGQGSMVTWNTMTDAATTSSATAAEKASTAGESLEAPPSYTRSKRHKHIKPPGKLMRLVTQASIQWDMLQDEDRLLLGLSGGKDSLSLLHVLLEFQAKLPIKFDIEVCTIDPMTPSFDPSPLIPYVESLGLKYHYIRDDIVARANQSGKDGTIVSSLCAFCARMKRGNLYTTARRNNCNKLVLAQHLDDLAESFLMSVMHNGFLRTMKANYRINAGDLSVIRPLVYCRESLMTEFAKSARLPIINENCPACFEEPKERARVKKLLSREETLYPNFYDNIKRSMLPLMHDDTSAILRSYTEEALAKSRKEQNGKNGKKKGRRQRRSNGNSSKSPSNNDRTDDQSPSKKNEHKGPANSGSGAEASKELISFSTVKTALAATAVIGFTSVTLASLAGSRSGRRGLASLAVAATGLAASRLTSLAGSVMTKTTLDDKPNNESNPATPPGGPFTEATDEDLVRELARRRAERFRLTGAMKRLGGDDDDDVDPTGQVCTLNGGNGSIPCRELME